ncbi:MAG: tripartite tricarboxylate transporter substrate binding protein BugD [Limnohabitans sp.]|jgi:tripartite-type tricarboxylate transporter receptor subunit TctC|nr:tripartite tricarboxylate transporter substrate binding protein BugD [Limnohabitans sp.]
MKSSFAGLLALSLLPFSLQAADFPIKDKPITLVVPFAAGGPTDRVARDLAEAMRKSLGNSVVVENAAGGPGGLIGATKVTRANPDGHTLLVHHIAMGIFPSLVRNLPFKVDSDFEYLGMINDVPMTLIGKPQLPANNYKELMAWVNANKGNINLANAGLASASHLCGMLWQAAVQVDMTTVPYKGTAPAMTDLIGGQVDLMCDQTTNTTSQIEAKKVKVFGVTTQKRLGTPALKDVPTLDETGQKNFQVTIWHGLYGPKGLSADAKAKLNNALKAALKDPDFIKKQEGLGAVVINDKRSDPVEHKNFVTAEIAKWTPVIKAAGVYAD